MSSLYMYNLIILQKLDIYHIIKVYFFTAMATHYQMAITELETKDGMNYSIPILTLNTKILPMCYV
jgi:hypothetical protein